MAKLPSDMYMDQYGNRFAARSRKELLAAMGRKSARKMYVDKKDGSTAHVGYVVGKHWLRAYVASSVQP